MLYDLAEQRRATLQRVQASIVEMENVKRNLPSDAPCRSLVEGVLRRLLANERCLSAYRSYASLTTTVGQVVVLGLNQLKDAGMAEYGPQCAALDKTGEEIANPTAAVQPHASEHFFALWHDAMCFHMGADEVEKFLLTWCPTNHCTNR